MLGQSHSRKGRLGEMTAEYASQLALLIEGAVDRKVSTSCQPCDIPGCGIGRIGAATGAALIAASLYPLLSDFFRRLRLHFLDYDRILRALLLVVGAYGAYALGANNVANVTGVFYKAAIISPLQALLIGGLSIGLGAITYSKNVMLTVGRKIIPMDAFTAFVTVFASAITVHIYSWIGVPVSSSQAIVGAVVGVGFLKGMRMVSAGTVTKIVIGWAVTPVMSAVISVLLVFLSKSWF